MAPSHMGPRQVSAPQQRAAPGDLTPLGGWVSGPGLCNQTWRGAGGFQTLQQLMSGDQLEIMALGGPKKHSQDFSW